MLLFALPPAVTLNVGGGPAPSAAIDEGEIPFLSGPSAARAAVSIQLSMDELIAASSYVVVATATERRSQWEEIGGSRRIVTYTRLSIDRVVAGQPDGEVWVRTLGGVVDDIGQYVSGDAQLALGTQAMLFLTQARTAVVVAGMAQGHYPIVNDPGDPGDEARKAVGAPRALQRRLAASPDSGKVLPRRGPTISARELLVGATLESAIDTVSRAWKTHHAAR